MRLRVVLLVALVVSTGAWGLLHAQKPFQQYAAARTATFPCPRIGSGPPNGSARACATAMLSEAAGVFAAFAGKEPGPPTILWATGT